MTSCEGGMEITASLIPWTEMFRWGWAFRIRWQKLAIKREKMGELKARARRTSREWLADKRSCHVTPTFTHDQRLNIRSGWEMRISYNRPWCRPTFTRCYDLSGPSRKKERQNKLTFMKESLYFETQLGFGWCGNKHVHRDTTTKVNM